jgi:L-asparaginase / beta-aspartyl-peptidase
LTAVIAADGWSLALHGGAGAMVRGALSPDRDAAARAALALALDVGSALLADGASAVDAVQATLHSLEDDPLFNAGRGAAICFDGAVELDAAIMDGRLRDAGAVARLKTTRHPIDAARAVMDHTPHVLLSGPLADRFAVEHGCAQEENAWFATPERLAQLAELLAAGDGAHWYDVDLKYGTVGAVARDRSGHVAAATSTGGLTGKRWGRIGDSPLIGAGTYADDRACAVSATGAGEFFIRISAAHEIAARIRLAGDGAQAAADAVLAEIAALGGSGGVIVVTPAGEAVFAFTTPGMYRARTDSAGQHEVAIYGDEPR